MAEPADSAADGRPRRGSKQDRCERYGSDCGGSMCGCCVCDVLSLAWVLLAFSVLLPDAGGTALAARGIRGYQRWLSRFTADCPSTPSCSAYAAAAVHELGARRGLRAAAARIGACGRR